MAAAVELEKSRVLIDALDAENGALKARLATEKRLSETLTELNSTRRSEAEALRTAISAKDEAIAAKDAVIRKQDDLIADLKRKRRSPLGRIGDILIGAAAVLILK